MYSLER